MSVEVELHEAPPPGFADFVGALRFGSGAARYRRADPEGQLGRFADPRFLVARDGGRIVGSYVLDFRTVALAGERVPGAYRALLGVAPSHRRSGVGRALVARASSVLDAAGALSWGCIDAGNVASLGLLAAGGAMDVGGLASWLSYAQWPRERVSPVRTRGTLHAAHERALAVSLEGCAAADVTPVADAAWALVEGERIVAAARVHRTELAFDTLGPLNDALVRRLVLPFGFARRRFDPRAFGYLRLTDIVLAPGDERLWRPFVSTLMARHGTHYALVVMDPSRPPWVRLRAASGRRAAVRPDLRVLVRAPGGSKDHIFAMAAGPVALHPVDV